MEYSVSCKLDKEELSEVGRVKRLRSRKARLLFICAIISLVIATPISIYVSKTGIQAFFLTFGIITLLLWALFDRLFVFVARKYSKKLAEKTLCFEDDVMYTDTHDGIKTSMEYSTIKAVLETDKLFIICSNAKQADIAISKAAFEEDELDNFRDYIEKKIGKRVKLHEKNENKRAYITTMVVCVICVILYIATAIVLTLPKIYTRGDFSIELPRKFKQCDMSDYEYSVSDGDAVVGVYSVEQSHYEGCNDITEFTTAIMNEYDLKYKTQFDMFDLENNSTNSASIVFSRQSANDVYSCMRTVIINSKEESLWVIDFYCKMSNFDTYAQLFETWAGTIKTAQ